MFWGLILKSNKKYTQTIEKPFHLSQASLDHSSSDDNPVQVMYTHEENSYLLCTLQKGKVAQCSLDLNFGAEKVCFSTKGNGIVHLTGYLIEDYDAMDDLMNASDDEEMSEEEENAMDEKLAKLNKKIQESKNQKKPASKAAASKVVDDEDEEDSDEEESDEEENITMNETATADDSEDDDDDDEEEDDEDDDEDEEDESDEESVEPPKKQAKTENGNAQNGKNGSKKEKLQNGANKPQQKENQKEQQKDQQGKVVKMQGGLMAQELKVGSGAEAKPGRKVQVFYEGRLKTNNKVFDSAKVGKGFKFSLGKGEVIKGWDIGITGMKVGGRRRLVIPPGLAYGSKGQPPVIPQNATLVFDVELKNVF